MNQTIPAIPLPLILPPRRKRRARSRLAWITSLRRGITFLTSMMKRIALDLALAFGIGLLTGAVLASLLAGPCRALGFWALVSLI